MRLNLRPSLSFAIIIVARPVAGIPKWLHVSGNRYTFSALSSLIFNPLLIKEFFNNIHMYAPTQMQERII